MIYVIGLRSTRQFYIQIYCKIYVAMHDSN